MCTILGIIVHVFQRLLYKKLLNFCLKKIHVQTFHYFNHATGILVMHRTSWKFSPKIEVYNSTVGQSRKGCFIVVQCLPHKPWMRFWQFESFPHSTCFSSSKLGTSQMLKFIRFTRRKTILVGTVHLLQFMSVAGLVLPYCAKLKSI